MNENTPYYVGFSHCEGIGPITFTTLLNVYESPKNAYYAPVQELKSLIGPYLARKWGDFRQRFDPIQKLEQFAKEEIQVITREDSYFPFLLKKISDPPICLYVKGNLQKINFDKEICLAVVGTRRASFYGKDVARQLTWDLASAGLVIVSGMATGIDTVAHEAALDANGKTVAFLGCGVDIIFPFHNKQLYWSIVEKGGLVISEFPPGMRTGKGLFVARNRLISGISKGVVVIEGLEDSGALITARNALAQGREVFAPPGPLDSDLSIAPNSLLKDGAKIVTSAEDILEEFKLSIQPRTQADISSTLPEAERLLFEEIAKQPVSSDDLVHLFSLSIGEVLMNLTSLEMQNIIEKNDKGRYQVKRKI